MENVDESQISILAEEFKKITKLSYSISSLLEVAHNLGGKISYDNPDN